MEYFARELCFWSFEHGFSKPDPHAFRLLTARLEARGLQSSEALMVGDSLENDIEPARAQGWLTWQLGPAADRDWPALGRWLQFTLSQTTP
jgi:FMN phosphatase YigB (HAD superfamily)